MFFISFRVKVKSLQCLQCCRCQTVLCSWDDSVESSNGEKSSWAFCARLGDVKYQLNFILVLICISLIINELFFFNFFKFYFIFKLYKIVLVLPNIITCWYVLHIFPNEFILYIYILWWWISCEVMSNSCDLMDCSPPSSFVHRLFQAKVLEWVAISFSRGSSWPRDWT